MAQSYFVHMCLELLYFVILYVFVFLKDAQTLEIKAESMLVFDDKLKMYWTPASSKWDMAPAYVKQVLFPDYHGAEYNVGKSTMLRKLDVSLDDDDTDKEMPVKLRCHLESAVVFYKQS